MDVAPVIQKKAGTCSPKKNKMWFTEELVNLGKKGRALERVWWKSFTVVDKGVWKRFMRGYKKAICNAKQLYL